MSLESDYLARQPITAERVKDYATADAYLGSKSERPVANNTRLHRRDDGTIAVKLHATDVVIYRRDGTAELRADGWQTVTTKERINSFSPARLAQSKNRWYLWRVIGWRLSSGSGADWTEPQRETEELPFVDGIRVDSDGWPIDAARILRTAAVQRRRDDRMLARIKVYVSGYMAELAKGMSAPNAGDCWYCLFFDRGAPSGSPDHLTEHMRERYYVPSLAVNALRAQGRPDYGIGLYLAIRADGTMGGHAADAGGHFSREVKRALTRYMRARLVPGVAR